jgi:hypothetical protein
MKTRIGSPVDYFTGNVFQAPIDAGFGGCEQSYPQSGTQFFGVNPALPRAFSRLKPFLKSANTKLSLIDKTAVYL